MSEGFVDLFECDDRSGNKPHYRGYLKIEGVNHEFALWPSKKGKGFSGRYKVKEERNAAPAGQKAPAKPPGWDDGTAPF